MCCRMFGSTPGLYPPDARSTPPLPYDNQKCFQMLPNVPWGRGQNCPQLRTTGLGCSHSLECPGMSSPYSLPSFSACQTLTCPARPVLKSLSQTSKARVNHTLTCAPKIYGHLIITVREDLSCYVVFSACLHSHQIVRFPKAREPVQRWIQVVWSFEIHYSWGGGNHL